jgi:hypothetical protein
MKNLRLKKLKIHLEKWKKLAKWMNLLLVKIDQMRKIKNQMKFIIKIFKINQKKRGEKAK